MSPRPRPDLKPGDPFTFVLSEPGMRSDGTPLRIGDRIGLGGVETGVFQITAVHEPASYETKFLGSDAFPSEIEAYIGVSL